MSTKQVTEPGMSDEAITRGTGKGWAEWAEILDKWGAADKPHTEIAKHVAGQFGVDGWWAQGVTVGYERMRGRRAVNETVDGFSANASKTYPVPIEVLFSAFLEDQERDRWLDRNALGLRTSQENRSARFDITESGKILEAWFTEKGPQKSSVALQINKLESAEIVAEAKALWKERLEKLATLFKSSTSVDG